MGIGATIAGIGIAAVAVVGLGYAAVKFLPGAFGNLFDQSPKLFSTPGGFDLPSQNEFPLINPLSLPTITDVPFIEGAAGIPQTRVAFLENLKKAFTIRTSSGSLTRSQIATPPLGSGAIAGIRGKPLSQFAISRKQPTFTGTFTTKIGGTRLVAGSEALFNRLRQNLARSSIRRSTPGVRTPRVVATSNVKLALDRFGSGAKLSSRDRQLVGRAFRGGPGRSRARNIFRRTGRSAFL